MRRAATFDMPLFLSFLVLVGLGIAFIYSASYPKALAASGYWGEGFAIARRQIIFAGVGLVALVICARFPLSLIHRIPGLLWSIIGVTSFLLLAVLLVGVAKHGNRAWIEIGALQFQPSELTKVAVIVTLSAYMAKRPWLVKSWKGLLSGPLWFLLIPVGLIVLQEDLGTAFVLTVATVVLLAIAGTKFRYWGVPTLLLLSLAVIAVMASPRAERIRAWKNPFDPTIQQAYQPRNSLIAIGSGGPVGRGFCQSRQKWFYLPGAHNDYILAVIAEELGFLKIALFLFLPYLYVIYRGFTIAHSAPDEYSAMVAAGCTVMLGTQALINMAVVLNLFPTMGINLPFISYGGTSLIASMMMAGLLLNVSAMRPARETRAMGGATNQPTMA